MKKILGRLAGVFGAGVIALTAFAGTAHATAIPGGGGSNVYQLSNGNSGQCLAVGASSTANGAGVIQWPCTGGAEQLWSFTDITSINGSLWAHVRNLNSGQCLAVPGGNLNIGYQLMQWPCGPWNDHYWQFDVDPTTGYAMLYNLNNQCAAIGASSLTAGAPAVEWTCTGGNEQLWHVS